MPVNDLDSFKHLYQHFFSTGGTTTYEHGATYENDCISTGYFG